MVIKESSELDHNVQIDAAEQAISSWRIDVASHARKLVLFLVVEGDSAPGAKGQS